MALPACLRRATLAALFAATLLVPFGAAYAAHGIACEEPEVEAVAEPVRFRFWIGPFEFSVVLGGSATVALAFEGLR